MNPAADPDLFAWQSKLRLISIVAWCVAAVPVVFLLLYLLVAGWYGTPFAAQMPVILGYLFALACGVAQAVFARGAVISFPRLPGMRLKVLLGLIGTMAIGAIIAATSSLVIRLLAGVIDDSGMRVLFACFVITLVPVAPFLFQAATVIKGVEEKYGPAGVQQLFEYQRWRGASSR